MTSFSWTPKDLEQMKALGVDPDEAARQIELFRNPPSPANLLRPATLRDGILRLTSSFKKEALKKYQRALLQGRFTKFVPASGAASRMFHLLSKFSQRETLDPGGLEDEIKAGKMESRQFMDFMQALHKMAFFEKLDQALSQKDLDLESLRKEGRFKEILETLLTTEGLNYAQRPKGIIQFHRYPSGKRTALEEHLVEAVRYVQDRAKRCRIHFTVSQEHADECRDHFMAVREKYEKKYGAKFNIKFSVQESSTDTLAVDMENRPFRDSQGKLVFRPAGHGALLENLNRLKADVLYIKNIDNVTLEHRLEKTVYWKKVLGGYLVSVQESIFKNLKKLHAKKITSKALKEIQQFASRTLRLDLGEDFKGLTAAEKIGRLKELLNRPLRVCGVVPSTGEPGGGPFWVKGRDGRESLQVVESAQIDLQDSGQKKIFESSTHFNPVDLVCGVRNWKGKLFDLKRFRDPDAVFVSRKSMQGRELKALELPGLWNGAMASWITLFVEVPLETFNPVKTVFDLLKPAHQ